MRVHVPATPDGLHPNVVPALLHAGAGEVKVAVCRKPLDYHFLLARWWQRAAAAHADLVVVEHDVVVDPGTLRAFAGCGEPWCAAPYVGGDAALLGCTRWRPHLLGPFPLRRPAPWRSDGTEDGLDMAVFYGLTDRGHRPHPHRPAPFHAHGWSHVPAAVG